MHQLSNLSASFLDSVKFLLDAQLVVLRDCIGHVVEVSGHTCAVWNSKYNAAVSDMCHPNVLFADQHHAHCGTCTTAVKLGSNRAVHLGECFLKCFRRILPFEGGRSEDRLGHLFGDAPCHASSPLWVSVCIRHASQTEVSTASCKCPFQGEVGSLGQSAAALSLGRKEATNGTTNADLGMLGEWKRNSEPAIALLRQARWQKAQVAGLGLP
mmetsp:Transcript_23/g.42  ORF Transcript_23/g.42 Transcript_23/m.42 type:complete len:212 (+) Transcript_23:632-1267(+)